MARDVSPVISTLLPTTIFNGAGSTIGIAHSIENFTGFVIAHVLGSAFTAGASVDVILEGDMDQTFANPKTIASIGTVNAAGVWSELYAIFGATAETLLPWIRVKATWSGSGGAVSIAVKAFWQEWN